MIIDKKYPFSAAFRNIFWGCKDFGIWDAPTCAQNQNSLLISV